MGWLDKVKVRLGIVDAEDVEEEDEPRAELRVNPTNREDRPPLDDVRAAPKESIEDALAAREAGNLTEMRRLLREMDRGQGLRLVLRAAAALEAKDERELGELMPRLHKEEQLWRLLLQIAAALDEEDGRAAALRARAAKLGAPAWALAWCEAMAANPETRRRGMVALLFQDAALARTVAARDWALTGAEIDAAATKRYTGFVHGRDSIRRFGATLVAELVERIA
ncbi:MAG TPA: hypothetical protein VFB62_11535 [Polyangiaceae bacterium]|nr:hypothetical protein [Polyangiaceae bacterium]